ncbi:MAG: ATP-binding protein [Cyanobacteriota bacterium]|nr:ATP-binding protein [Cyanobacteriota bacterium]
MEDLKLEVAKLTQEKAALVQDLERLRGELDRLQQEKLDLEILLETTTEHGDAVEEDLHSTTEELYLTKTDLELLLETTTQHGDLVEDHLYEKAEELSRSKADLELILETTTEHGDTVEASLHKAEARYRGIFENAMEGMCQIAPDGNYIDVNYAMARIYGYPSPSEMVEHSRDRVPQLFYLEPEDHHRFIRLLQEKGQVSRLESQVYRKDGRIIWIAQSARAVYGEGGTLHHYEGLVEDITERKKIDRLKNEFVSTVSHELRTPLTSIRGALGLIVGGVLGELPAQARALTEIAYRSSERLVLLINDILDIEKIEAGRMEFNVQPMALVPIIQQSVEANLAFAAQYGVRVDLEPGYPDVWVNADSNRLLQVLTNLLSNAAKFSPPDSVVKVVVSQQGSFCRVAVIDQGCGISEEFRSYIFQKFAQSDSSNTRQRGGTGLGLSISKAIVEKLGGHIGFDSVVNQGTTFYFDLPIWHPHTFQSLPEIVAH